jgi:hypothetical protein
MSVLFAVVHVSAYGTKRTSNDVRSLVSIGGIADIGRTASLQLPPWIFSHEIFLASAVARSRHPPTRSGRTLPTILRRVAVLGRSPPALALRHRHQQSRVVR